MQTLGSSRADEAPTVPGNIHFGVRPKLRLKIEIQENVSILFHYHFFIFEKHAETSGDGARNTWIPGENFHTECMYRASRDAHWHKTSAQTKKRVPGSPSASSNIAGCEVDNIVIDTTYTTTSEFVSLKKLSEDRHQDPPYIEWT